jgi:hypothetical protein
VSIFNSRLFKNLIFFVFVAVMILVGGYGILLIMQVWEGNGNSEGNSLIFVLGLVLIIVSGFSLSIGILHWRSVSFRENSKKST